jgi:hypothetical protein
VSKSLTQLDNFGLENGLTALVKNLEQTKQRVESLRKGTHVALAIQNGNIKDLDEAYLFWAKIRGDLEKIQIAGLVLDALAARYLDDPRSTAPEWWALFPKEAFNERVQSTD